MYGGENKPNKIKIIDEFEMKDMETQTKFLDIEITRDLENKIIYVC